MNNSNTAYTGNDLNQGNLTDKDILSPIPESPATAQTPLDSVMNPFPHNMAVPHLSPDAFSGNNIEPLVIMGQQGVESDDYIFGRLQGHTNPEQQQPYTNVGNMPRAPANTDPLCNDELNVNTNVISVSDPVPLVTKIDTALLNINQSIQNVPIVSYDIEPEKKTRILDKGEVSLGYYISDRINVDLKTCHLGRIALNPLVSQHAIIGTEGYEDEKHFLMCVDIKRMEKENCDPIVSLIEVNEHIRDTIWVTPNTVLAGIGSDISIFSLSNNQEFHHKGTIRRLHDDWIRQMAFDHLHPNYVVTGGFDIDSGLVMCDINSFQSPNYVFYKRNIGEVISSIKMRPNTIAITTDPGNFSMFDIRDGLSIKPQFTIETKKPQLYSMEMYNDHNVLLGYGDGIIQQVDTRKNCMLEEQIKDPYVTAIGDILYNNESNAFVTSGLTDFSVWRHSLDSGKAKIWTHSVSNPNPRIPSLDFSMNAVWLSSNEIISSNSQGSAAIYKQDFKFKY